MRSAKIEKEKQIRDIHVVSMPIEESEEPKDEDVPKESELPKVENDQV